MRFGQTKKIILFLGDITILYFSLWLTLLIRYPSEYNYGVWQNHLFPFSVVFLIWLAVFYVDDLYELYYSKTKSNLINRLMRVTVINGIIAIIFFYLASGRLFLVKPQKVLVIILAIVFLLLYLWRLLFAYFSKLPQLANNVLIVGINPLALELINEIAKNPQLGYQVKIVFDNTPGSNALSEALNKNLKVINQIDNLKQITLENHIGIIVTAANLRQDPLILKNLFECLSLNITFSDLATFYEKITGKIPVSTIEQIWFLENLTEKNKKLYKKIKRIIDIFLAILALIVTLPFLPLIILAIKLDSRGPIFFAQKRVGKDGKTFLALKLRSMIVEAEKNGPQWAQKNDPRITRVGKFIRKTRIDEIPQLLNVILGEMSIVGPRPERPEFVEQLQNQIPFYKERLLVKPGLTGWAQVAGPAYGGSREESLEKLQHDLFYIKNQSLALDLSILLKTIRIILSRQGQ